MLWEEEILQSRVDLRAFSSWSAVLGKYTALCKVIMSGVAAAQVRSSVAISYI
jgi:hypothetical protein